MTSLARRRALLVAALGFLELRWRRPALPAVALLAAWLGSWQGAGVVIAGLGAQGYDVELRQFPHGWRVNVYPSGTAHSVVAGSAWEVTAWDAVRRAAWAALATA